LAQLPRSSWPLDTGEREVSVSEDVQIPKSMLAAALLAVVATAAAARPLMIGNLDFLREAPMTFHDKKDSALFRQTAVETLNDAKDGETRTWSNPETGSSGEVTVVRTLPKTDATCRELRITNRAGGRKETGLWIFCHEPDKERWQMRPRAR
jgi:hypothetical protein